MFFYCHTFESETSGYNSVVRIWMETIYQVASKNNKKIRSQCKVVYFTVKMKELPNAWKEGKINVSAYKEKQLEKLSVTTSNECLICTMFSCMKCNRWAYHFTWRLLTFHQYKCDPSCWIIDDNHPYWTTVILTYSGKRCIHFDVNFRTSKSIECLSVTFDQSITVKLMYSIYDEEIQIFLAGCYKKGDRF